MTANQIVTALLDDFADGGREEYDQRPGGSKDMWRQGGFKNFSFKGNKFTGQRPGEKLKSAEDKEKTKPVKINSRFTWSPPKTESLQALLRPRQT